MFLQKTNLDKFRAETTKIKVRNKEYKSIPKEICKIWHIWTLKDALLNNPWIKNEITRKTTYFLNKKLKHTITKSVA